MNINILNSSCSIFNSNWQDKLSMEKINSEKLQTNFVSICFFISNKSNNSNNVCICFILFLCIVFITGYSSEVSGL